MSKVIRKSVFENQNWFFSRPYRIIFIACILLYAQILTFGLVYFDDHGFVLMAKNHLVLSNIPEFFRHSVFWVLGDASQETDVFYRPLQNVVYAVCNTFGSGQAWLYHLFGLGFHALASCLLFRFFIELRFHSSVSLLFTLFYSVHPVLVQGVAWIAGMGDQIATVLVLFSTIFFFRFIFASRKKIIRLFIHLTFFTGALFSKEVSIMLIPLCLFWYFFLNSNKNTKSLFTLLIAWSGIVVFYFTLRNAAVFSVQTSLLALAFESFKVNGPLVLEYFEKMFLPYRLSPIPSRDDAQYAAGGMILSIFIALFIFRKKFTRLAMLGVLWFLFFLFPSFIQQNPQAHFFAFEHRLYLPFIGILMMLTELLNLKEINFRSPARKFGFALLLILLSGITFSHSRTFKDPYAFYHKALSASPQSVIAYNGFGKLLLTDEKYAEAIEAFKKSHQYQPDDLQTTGKIAEIYLKNLHNPQEAVVWFKKTLAIDSTSVEAAVSIGDTYFHYIRDTANAEIWYRNALKISPENEFALANLGIIQAGKRNYDSAKNFLSEALESNDENLTALKWLAIVLFNEGKISDAVGYLQSAFSKHPSDTEISRNLMICYYKLNDFSGTKKYAELYLKSGNPLPEEIEKYLNGR